jgi:antitoxin VapB
LWDCWIPDIEARDWRAARIISLNDQRSLALWQLGGTGPSFRVSAVIYSDTRYDLEECGMAFHIKNPETDALARKVAALKKIGLTDAVHAALVHELEREQGKPSLVDLGVQFCRDLRARGNPAEGQPADKAFRDSLYEDT